MEDVQTPAVVSEQVVSQSVSIIVSPPSEVFKGLFSEALTEYPPAPPADIIMVEELVDGVLGVKVPKFFCISLIEKEKGIIE